jgi:hypothetical protein
MITALRADEGMWIPLLIEKFNITLMQEKGFKLSAEDIYSVNKASMKDAVLNFGKGCTGALISSQGLLITNHHCGYSQIQRHSSIDHDYLTNGFWAMSSHEELTCPGLTITLLKRMEDVTERVLAGVTEGMKSDDRDKLISLNIKAIEKKAVEGTIYSVGVIPFFMGNQYFLLIKETFSDIRLVGAPPSAIGKFGGDTDNWMWPRHTGDFSLFRVYADKNNKPSGYSKDNVPYKPAYYFPISLGGVKENDFTMVLGFPGTTNEYVPSYYIEFVKNYFNPEMIDIRTKKIDIINKAMESDPLLRIQYSSKVAAISNSWKKWIGELQGLERMNTVGKKQEFEMHLINWIESDEARKSRYGDILPSFKKLYESHKEYSLVNSYTDEVMTGIEAINFSKNVKILIDKYEADSGEVVIKKAKDNLISAAKVFFRDYNAVTDKKLFIELMKMYGENLEVKWQSTVYIDLKNSCKGDFAAIADKLYNKSVFTDENKFNTFIRAFNKSSLNRIKKDPIFNLSNGFITFLEADVRPELNRLGAEIKKLNKDFMTAQMEFDKKNQFYPDANFTLRLAYGTVKGYHPKDAVYYSHYTTLKGIIEKNNPAVYDYDVPDRLEELYSNRDYGKYSQNGDMPVCFIADNHTTGGNSGSPVINADGQLIGVNFDRAWEGVASDLAFNPELSRNISLDIRYALFIIDKFAGAGYLLNEMSILE